MYDRNNHIHFGRFDQPNIDVTGKHKVETKKEQNHHHQREEQEEEEEQQIHDAHNELIENRFEQFLKKVIGLIFVFFKKIFYF